MRINITLLLVILIALLSCKEDSNLIVRSTEKLEVGNYSWNSYKVSQMRGGLTYSAINLPIEYYLRKNIGVTNIDNIDSLANVMSSERVIIAEFNHLDRDDVLKSEYTNRTYEEAVKYIASAISKDYHFITSKQDTIPCIGVLFERNFNVAPFKRVLLYFNDIPPGDMGELLYDDQLFGNGSFSFKLNQRPIKS